MSVAKWCTVSSELSLRSGLRSASACSVFDKVQAG